MTDNTPFHSTPFDSTPFHSTVEEHAARIALLLSPVLARRAAESVALDDALGRVTASDVVSPVDLPLFRNSQMDGFAVATADLTEGVELEISQDIPARPIAPPPLSPGTAARIMTGAVVPEGADAVVPVEDTSVSGTRVIIDRVRRAGEFVRERGSDVLAGQLLLPAGVRLGSRHLAALAAAGLTSVEVLTPVRVGIITTGSELVLPGAHPEPGQVFDSNATALAAAVRSVGAVVSARTHVADDVAAMTAALRGMDADVIVTSGGISMGDYEVVRETLEPLGARVGHVAMQPGGPQATAMFDGTPVICFPGNPVSTQVSFEVFLAPLLRQAAALPPARRETRALSTTTTSPAGKRQFLRGRATGDRAVDLVSGASSHLVAGLAAATVLVVVPEDVTVLHEGDDVETWAL